jgi:hypothetical protein
MGGIVADPDTPLTNRLERDLGDPHQVVNKAVEYGLRDAMSGKPSVNFVAPPKDLALGKRAGIPNVKCRSVDDATRALRGAGFQVAVDRDPIASECAAGTVATTAPTGETSRNGFVTIVISKGPGNPDPGQGGGRGQGGGQPGVGPPDNRICDRFPFLCQNQTG